MSKRRRAGRPALLTPRTRRWAYGVAATGLTVAAGYGLVTEHEAALWLNFAGSVLFIVAAGNTPSRPSEVPTDEHEPGSAEPAA